MAIRAFYLIENVIKKSLFLMFILFQVRRIYNRCCHFQEKTFFKQCYDDKNFQNFDVGIYLQNLSVIFKSTISL